MLTIEDIAIIVGKSIVTLINGQNYGYYQCITSVATQSATSRCRRCPCWSRRSSCRHAEGT